MSKIKNICLLSIFIFSLLFAGCPDMFNLFSSYEDELLVSGKGYITINIEGDRVGRTIIPSTPGFNSLHYKLIFNGTPLFEWPDMEDEEEFRSYTELSRPILLDADDYTLEIEAYRLEDDGITYSLVAFGEDEVEIVAGGGITCDITLRAIISSEDPNATGTFSWKFTILDQLDTSKITVTVIVDPLDTAASYVGKNDPEVLFNDILDGNEEKSEELPVGYYNVKIKFENEDVKVKDIIINEVLYVYQNLESILEIRLSEAFFNSNWYEVTFVYNDDVGNTTQGSVEHGKAELLSLPAPAPGSKEDYLFAGWYTDADPNPNVGNKWISLDPDSQKNIELQNRIAIRNFSLYAKWFKDLGAATINVTDPVFKGTAYTPQDDDFEYSVYDGLDLLVRGTHYNASITAGGINAGSATITITAIPGSGYDGTNFKVFTINRKPINGINISGIRMPSNGVLPSTDAEYDDGEYQGVFKIDSVIWKTGGETFAGAFLGSTVYSVEVTLSLITPIGDDYTFEYFDDAEINGHEAVILDKTMTSAVISFTFGATSNKQVNNMTITAQPSSDMEYIHGQRLNLAAHGIKVTLFYTDTSSEEFEPEDFYDNSITTIPDDNHTLEFVGLYNNHPIKVEGHGIERETTAKLVISKATPTPVTPTGLTAIFGQTLADVQLPPRFTWEQATDTPVGPVLGPNNFTVKYTPADPANYNDVTGIQVTIAVSEADPNFTPPSDRNATYGDRLNSVGLPTGFSWEDLSNPFVGTVAGLNIFTVRYTPVDTNNYKVMEGIPVTINVSAKALTINSAVHTRHYDGTTNANGVTNVTLTGTVGEDSVSVNTFTAAYQDAAATTTTLNISSVTLVTNTVSGNYTVTSGSVTVDGITKRPITIVPNPVSKNYASPPAADPALTFKSFYEETEEAMIIGIGNVETGSLSRANPTVHDVGTYLISGTISWGDNYDLTFSSTPVYFTINKVDTSYNPPTDLTAIYGQTLANVTLPEKFTWELSSSTPVGTVAGPNNFTVKYTPEDTNYDEVTGIPVTISVSAKELTITGVSATDRAYAPANTTVALTGGTLVGVLAGDTTNVGFTLGNGTIVNANAGDNKSVTTNITLTSLNSTTAANNYTLTQPTNVTVNIATVPLTITGVSATTRDYAPANTTVALTGGTLVGVLAADNVGFTLGSGTIDNANAGDNKAVTTNITLTGSAADNYTLTQPTNVTVNIATVPLTITGVNATNRVYDPANTTVALTGGTLVGVLAADTTNVGFTLGSGTIATADAGVGKIVTTNIALTSLNSTTAANNYTLTQPTITVTINKAPGAAVDTFTLGNTTTTSLDITAATLVTGTGQTIQYAWVQSATVPTVTPTNWADLPVITPTTPFTIPATLQTGLLYHVYIRSKESDNYLAGTEERRQITTVPPSDSNLDFSFIPLFNGVGGDLQSPQGLELSLSGAAGRPTSITFTLNTTVDGGLFEWYVGIKPMDGNTNTFTLSNADFLPNGRIGPVQAGATINISVDVLKDGIPYTQLINVLIFN